MASCTVKFYVKDPDGNMVESRLFNDLSHHFRNRETAKEWYFVGTSDKFLSRVKFDKRLKFDENGEITFKSLRALTGKLNLAEQEELDMLNNDIGAGEYSFDDALTKLQKFNRDSNYNDKYLATIVENENGKFNLFVTKKDAVSQSQLNSIIANMNTLDRIKYYLKKAGIDPQFIDADIDGEYSLDKSTTVANGLYQAIRVANGENVTGDLARQAGRFIVDALYDTEIMKRLMGALSDEVQKKIYEDNNLEVPREFNDSTARYAAAILIGKAIEGDADAKTAFGKLIDRIVAFAKRVFNSISRNKVANLRLEAEVTADNIARGFMSPHFIGDAANVSGNYSVESKVDSVNIEQFKKIVTHMKLQAEQMKQYAGDRAEMFVTMAGLIESKVSDFSAGSMSDAMALEGIAESVLLMADLMTYEIPSLLEKVDFNNIATFSSGMVEGAKALRAVRTYAQTSAAICQIIKEVLPDIGHFAKKKLTGDVHNIRIQDISGSVIYKDLETISTDLQSAVSKLVSGSLIDKEREFYKKFCSEMLGADYVKEASGKIWGKYGKLKTAKENIVRIDDMLDYLESDITRFEAYLSSAANSSDLITQIADKAAKMSNKWADDMTADAQMKLISLRNKLKKLTKHTDTRIFCEIGRDGTLTGNFVSKYVWGDYESDKEEFINEHKAIFRKAHPELAKMSDFTKSVKWSEYFLPKMKEWHKGSATKPAHSQWSIEENRYIPSNLYLSKQYTDGLTLSDGTKMPKIQGTELEEWLNEMMDLKRELDSRLPEGATNLYRMPQFRGTYINRVKNKKLFEGTGKAMRQTLCFNLRAKFCEDSEDRDYGSELNYNKPEDDMFNNQLAYEKEKINRLPLFGINKMKDVSNISTDFFYSMFSYAGMVNSYAAMGQIVDTLEVGTQVLRKRKVGRILEEEKGNEHSRAFTRYQKFLDKQVYGISAKKVKVGKIVVNKVANFLSSLGSRIFLGGNVAGGMVNLGTGIVEIFKEAAAGEYFNMHDWRVAHREYYNSLPSNIWTEVSGDQLPSNKVALMIQHFNITGNEKERQQSWHKDGWSKFKRAWPGMLGDNAFFPYKMGDHYMQSIAYLALASKTKVYDSKGNPISLLNAYKRGRIDKNAYRLVLSNDEKELETINKVRDIITNDILKDTEITAGSQVVERIRDVLNKTEDKELVKKFYDLVDVHSLRGTTVDATTAINTILSTINEKEVENKRFYKSRKAKEDYQMITNIYNKISESASSGGLGSPMVFTDEEQKFIDENKIDLASTDNALAGLNNERNKLIWTIDDEVEFMMKAREINNRLHGIYNHQDKVAMQQTIMGNMLTAMKGYALGMSERRFGSNKGSIALGLKTVGGEKILEHKEGSLNTLAKMIASCFTDRGGFKTTMMALTLPVLYGKKTKEQMLKMGYSENQFYNMRRNFFDYLFIAALGLLRMSTALSPDDDDNDDDVANGLVYYFASRLFREQSAYNWPGTFVEEAQSIFNINPVGFSVLMDLTELARLGLGYAFVDDREDSDYYYTRGKPGFYEVGDSKFSVKLQKIIPYWRSTFVFENPYEAAKSYEYGRRLKAK